MRIAAVMALAIVASRVEYQSAHSLAGQGRAREVNEKMRHSSSYVQQCANIGVVLGSAAELGLQCGSSRFWVR